MTTDLSLFVLTIKIISVIIGSCLVSRISNILPPKQ